MKRNYKLTDETIEVAGRTLHRIECTKAFMNGDNQINIGDKGGFVEFYSNLYGNAEVFGNAWVYGNAKVYGDARVFDNARVYDNAEVYGYAKVFGDAEVTKTRDYCCFQIFGSRDCVTTAFRTKEGIKVVCGCFYGTIDEFAEKVEKTHRNSQYGKEYRAMIELIKVRFEINK